MIHRISRKTAMQIVETVKDVCGQDINYIDLDGIIYASTNESRIGQFHAIGKQVADQGETIEVDKEDNFYGTKPGVNIPISHKGNIVAVIGITGLPDEVRKYAYLAQKITFLLLREQELDRQEQDDRTKMNYMIRSLTDVNQNHNNRVENYIKENKIDTASPYQLVCIRLNKRYNPSNLSLIENKIDTVFYHLKTSLHTFHYPNEYIAIVKQKILNSRIHLLEQLEEDCMNVLKISVSMPHNLYEQHIAYTEAKLAMKSSAGSSSVLFYENLGIEILCSAANEELSAMYREKYLSMLEPRDIELLKVYYQENMSLTKTSERLFLHKNTIQYQLDKIHRLTGYNPRLFVDAAGFYSALLM